MKEKFTKFLSTKKRKPIKHDRTIQKPKIQNLQKLFPQKAQDVHLYIARCIVTQYI
jgi:hypothetical protein